MEDVTIERLTLGTQQWQLSYADHISRYEFAVPFAQGKKVLDVGTGPGYGALMMKVRGAQSVQAMDIDPNVIAVNQREHAVAGLEYLVDDSQELSKVSGPFDVLCSFENIEHLPHPERFVEAAARQLKDDGVMLCSTPAREFTNPTWVNGKPSNPFHVTEWYRDEFYSMLAQRFEDITLYCQVHTHAYLIRQQAAFAQFRFSLRHLWTTARSRLGMKSELPLSYLVTQRPAPQDIAIVPERIAPIFGKTFVHVAVCRRPKRG